MSNSGPTQLYHPILVLSQQGAPCPVGRLPPSATRLRRWMVKRCSTFTSRFQEKGPMSCWTSPPSPNFVEEVDGKRSLDLLDLHQDLSCEVPVNLHIVFTPSKLMYVGAAMYFHKKLGFFIQTQWINYTMCRRIKNENLRNEVIRWAQKIVWVISVGLFIQNLVRPAGLCLLY